MKATFFSRVLGECLTTALYLVLKEDADSAQFGGEETPWGTKKEQLYDEALDMYSECETMLASFTGVDDLVKVAHAYLLVVGAAAEKGDVLPGRPSQARLFLEKSEAS